MVTTRMKSEAVLKSDSKLSSVLCGISGEYFVAAELSKRGYIASITLRNTRGVDILASNVETSRTAAIQVKTNQGSKKAWILNEKAEKFSSPNHYYVFVSLRTTTGYPEFHIVPSSEVARYVKEGHSSWLRTPGKKGQIHKDTPMRQFLDTENRYLGRWELLALD